MVRHASPVFESYVLVWGCAQWQSICPACTRPWAASLLLQKTNQTCFLWPLEVGPSATVFHSQESGSSRNG